MKKILMTAGLAVPFISFAHDGHGTTSGYSIIHYFVEPDHAIYTWSFIAVGLVIAKYLRERKASK